MEDLNKEKEDPMDKASERIEEAMEDEVLVNAAQAEDVDYTIPVIPVVYKNQLISEVLLDGGSGVNIIYEYLYKTFCTNSLLPAPL